MITAPANWDTLWAADGTVQEMRFTIDSDSYLNADMEASDCRLTHSLYESYGIGNACSARLTVTLFDPEPIADGVRECTLECRLVSADGETATDWVPQGTYYLDAAVWSDDGETVQLTMYDALALADTPLYSGGTAPSNVTWPLAASSVVQQACARIGISAPSDMSALSGISCPNVDNITCRESLSSIAAIAGGNWTVTKAGPLKFVPLCDASSLVSGNADTVISVSDLQKTSTMRQVGKVSLRADAESFESGSGAFLLEADCLYAGSSAATAAYSSVAGKKYQGYSASGAFVSPLVELGDSVETSDGNILFHADSYMLTYGQGCWGEVSAPLRDELERRITAKTASDRKVNRLAAVMSDTMTAEEYIAGIIDRLNAYANATGGYTYITQGHGLRTYDVAVSDPLVGSEAHCVVEMKGGSVRIANSRNQDGTWAWQTLLNSGSVASGLITAVNIVAGFIGSPSGNYFDLDNGLLQAVAGMIGGFTIGQGMLYNGLSSLTGTASGVYIGTNGIACSGEYDLDDDGTTEQYSIAFSGGGIQGYYEGEPVVYITPNAEAYEITNNGSATDTLLHGLQVRSDIIDLRANTVTVKPSNTSQGDSIAVVRDFTAYNSYIANVSYDANTYFEFKPLETRERFVNGMLVSRQSYWYSALGSNSEKVKLATLKYVDDQDDYIADALNSLASRVLTLEGQVSTLQDQIADKVDKSAFTLSGTTLSINT